MSFNDKPVTYFDDRPAKEYLENSIYDYVGQRMLSNTLQVTGPAVARHLNNAKKIARHASCSRYIMEIDQRIFSAISKRVIAHKLSDPDINDRNVEVGLGNAVEYERILGLSKPCRFEDMDFCQSLDTSVYLIAHRLHTQARPWPGKYAELNKCLVFTSAIRPSNMEKSLEWLKIILHAIGAILSVKETLSHGTLDIGYSIKSWSPALLQTGRLLGPKSLKIYNYRDSHPMMSCVILYK